jgi:hypothetical protein
MRLADSRRGERGSELQIGNEADAKAFVRKYINGTRSRHRKIASILMEEESKSPDEKGVWTIKGSYVTEDGHKEPFTASVTSRGEVLLTTTSGIQDTSGKQASKDTKRRSS